MSLNAMDTVRAAWGADAPEWVWKLAAECNRTSQRRVAAMLKRPDAPGKTYSGAMVNMVLGGKRPLGTLGLFERAVRAALMNETVQCPVQGEIGLTECRANAARPFAATNPVRVKLWRACRECEHGRSK